MSFKIYKNKITGHASVSIKQRDKKHWYNLPMSHSQPKDSYIKVNDPHPKASKKEHSYVRKYLRKDKRGVKSRLYKGYKFSPESESKIKNYLKDKFKKEKMMSSAARRLIRLHHLFIFNHNYQKL